MTLLRILWRLIKFFGRLLRQFFKNYFKTIGRIIVLGAVIYTLGLIASKKFDYKVDWRETIEHKILDKFIAYARSPRTRLFTIYGRELGFNSMDQVEYIKNEQVLEVDSLEKNIFIGIWNDENKDLESVVFILFIPENIEVKDYDGWIPMFVNKQYNYEFPKKIRRNSGLMLHPTLKVKFLNKEPYHFKYKILCDDFLTKDGSFWIKIKQK
ncbi:MAG: hypothetical protein V1674_06315 [Candidatus Omnitrophota bacterium]